jgi:hypothetical protein
VNQRRVERSTTSGRRSFIHVMNERHLGRQPSSIRRSFMLVRAPPIRPSGQYVATARPMIWSRARAPVPAVGAVAAVVAHEEEAARRDLDRCEVRRDTTRSPAIAHWPPVDSAVGGGMKTVMSPSCGSPPTWYEKRSTITRWPTTSVGAIDSDGILLGLTAKRLDRDREEQRGRHDRDGLDKERRRPPVTNAAGR